MRPCCTNSRSARLTVMREMPNWLTNSFSDGRRSPVRQRPCWILRAMKSLTCSYSAMAGAGGGGRRGGGGGGGGVGGVGDHGRKLKKAPTSVPARRHGLGANLFGQARLERNECGAGLGTVVARVRQVHRQIGL